MPIRRRMCACVLGCVLAPAWVTAQERSERELVELVLRDGPRARAIRAESEVVRREQLARLTYPNPTVQYSREGAGFTEFFQVEQSLPVFGVRGALSRAGVAATEAAEAERDARLWTLRAEAAAALARLMAEQDRVQSMQAHIANVERTIEILRTREREGEGSRFDRLRAEQELRDARQAATTARVQFATARAEVSALLPPGTTFSRVVGIVSSDVVVPRLDGLITRAASTRAELRAIARAGDRADREADAARRSRLPGPTVFGGLKRADDLSRRERGGVWGLNITLPLFDTGSREAARWAAERTRVDAERSALEESIRAEITGASETLTLRLEALSGEGASAGDELMQMAEVAYREGEVGILELLDAMRTASRAAIRTIDIRLDARLAQIALERATGDMLWP